MSHKNVQNYVINDESIFWVFSIGRLELHEIANFAPMFEHKNLSARLVPRLLSVDQEQDCLEVSNYFREFSRTFNIVSTLLMKYGYSTKGLGHRRILNIGFPKERVQQNSEDNSLNLKTLHRY